MKYQPKLTLLLLFILFPIVSGHSQISVNQNRLEQRIFDLAKLGLQDNGETERVAFSDANIEANKWVISELTKMGLETHTYMACEDPKKNITGKSGSGYQSQDRRATGMTTPTKSHEKGRVGLILMPDFPFQDYPRIARLF